MNKVDHRLSTALACLVCLCMSGCAQAATTPTGVSTANAYPAGLAQQAAPMAVRTIVSVAETQTPVPSDTPTVAPTATPDGPLAPNGPWLVFLASNESQYGSRHLWVINADGSGLRELVDRSRPEAWITGQGRMSV